MTEQRVYLISSLLLVGMVSVVIWAVTEVKKDFSIARDQIQRESFSTVVEKNPTKN